MLRRQLPKGPTVMAAASNPRSSKAKGWVLILLTLGIIALLYAVFDLSSQFKLKEAAREAASAATQRLAQRPQPRPTYRQVAGDSQARTAADQ